MEFLKMMRELATIAVLALVMGILIAAAFTPERYGEWLQRIDNGRFQNVDGGHTGMIEENQ